MLSHMRTRRLEERVLVLLDSIPRTMKCHIDTLMLLNVMQQAGRYHWRLVDFGVHESSRMRKSDPGSLEITMAMPSFDEHLGQKKLEIRFAGPKSSVSDFTTRTCSIPIVGTNPLHPRLMGVRS